MGDYERELVVIGALAAIDDTDPRVPCRHCQHDVTVPEDSEILEMLTSGGSMLCQPCATLLFNRSPAGVERADNPSLCEICQERLAVIDIPAWRVGDFTSSRDRRRLFVCRPCAEEPDGSTPVEPAEPQLGDVAGTPIASTDVDG